MFFALDFLTCLSAAVSAFLLLIAGLWLRRSSAETREKHRMLDPRFIWVCAVCTYNYVNTRDESISVCPRCASFNKK